MLGKTVSANVIFLMYYRLLVKVVCYFGMMCSLGDLVSTMLSIFEDLQMPCTFVCVQMIVCLCDAFSTPQYPPTVIQSPRSSSSVAPKVTGGSGGDNEAGDTEPDDVEPSDVDVRFFLSAKDIVTT